MGCYRSVPDKPFERKAEKQVRMTANVIEDDSKTYSDGKVRLKTTRSNLAKYILKFPKIRKAYNHLLNGWCEAIQKKRPESAAAVFGLSGPAHLASKALSLCGIVTTNDYISQALASGLTSPRKDQEVISFKDLVISLSWLKKFGDENALKRLENDENSFKHDNIMNGLKIVRDMFEQIDVDGSEAITFVEFRDGFAGLGDDEIHEQRMKELDFNNDKEISYPEFCVGIAVWVGFVDEFH